MCKGGILAASTLIPGKLDHLIYDTGSLNGGGIEHIAEHSLQLFGSFLVLSVLIWASRVEPRKTTPLLAYSAQSKEIVIVHSAGLLLGVFSQICDPRALKSGPIRLPQRLIKRALPLMVKSQ